MQSSLTSLTEIATEIADGKSVDVPAGISVDRPQALLVCAMPHPAPAPARDVALDAEEVFLANRARSLFANEPKMLVGDWRQPHVLISDSYRDGPSRRYTPIAFAYGTGPGFKNARDEEAVGCVVGGRPVEQADPAPTDNNPNADAVSADAQAAASHQ